VVPHASGLRATMVIAGKTHALDIPLYGAFQLYNIAAAMGMLGACGVSMEECLSHVGSLKGVPGRLELAVTCTNGALGFVDYAHTPAALENILRTLRAHTAGRLHVLFGCGGDRDTGKRPEMGAVAAKLADHVMVTDDNPRSENPSHIRASILAACPGAKEIGDRREAIFAAVNILKPGDVLVVAGKGHEHTQLIGNQTFPFNDAAVLQEAANV
jgi:UDP-N-acetylmuramoyl-L-alanyl-D-glutamate--2,6-diaminopimelate ligase